jgi:hypothetical protein
MFELHRASFKWQIPHRLAFETGGRKASMLVAGPLKWIMLDGELLRAAIKILSGSGTALGVQPILTRVGV